MIGIINIFIKFVSDCNKCLIYIFVDLTEDSNVSIEEVVVSKMSSTCGYNPNSKDEEKAKKDNTVDSSTELKNKDDHSEKTANMEQEKQSMSPEKKKEEEESQWQGCK